MCDIIYNSLDIIQKFLGFERVFSMLLVSLDRLVVAIYPVEMVPGIWVAAVDSVCPDSSHLRLRQCCRRRFPSQPYRHPEHPVCPIGWTDYTVRPRPAYGIGDNWWDPLTYCCPLRTIDYLATSMSAEKPLDCLCSVWNIHCSRIALNYLYSIRLLCYI